MPRPVGAQGSAERGDPGGLRCRPLTGLRAGRGHRLQRGHVTGAPPDAPELDEAVFELVVGLGGSISAEHGVGTAKARFLPMQRSEAELAAMRAIKSALDPSGILNPHVLLPRPP